MKYETWRGQRLSAAGPQPREPPVQRGDQTIQFPLPGLQLANLKSHARHGPKPDDLLAFHTVTQPSAASHEIVGDLLPLVGEKPPKVCPLRGVRRTGRAFPLHTNGHRRNLTAPLTICHSNHIIRLSTFSAERGRGLRSRFLTRRSPRRAAAGHHVPQPRTAGGWAAALRRRCTATAYAPSTGNRTRAPRVPEGKAGQPLSLTMGPRLFSSAWPVTVPWRGRAHHAEVTLRR